jgi:hypothetical protein
MKKILIIAAPLMLIGCSADKWEGGGFYNSGKKAKPATCEQIDPLHIKCYTIRK